MRDRDAGDGGPPDVIIRDEERAGYRGQHPDLVTGVREVRQDGRLDSADDLERARAHDGNARTRTGLQVPAPATDHAAPFTGSGGRVQEQHGQQRHPYQRHGTAELVDRLPDPEQAEITPPPKPAEPAPPVTRRRLVCGQWPRLPPGTVMPRRLPRTQSHEATIC